MYSVGVARRFAAAHFLINADGDTDWGAEGELHTHTYRLELQLQGAQLDRHGFLIDITAVEATADAAVSRYAGKVLNDLPELSGCNPSVERLAALFCRTCSQALPAATVQRVTVRLWEKPDAWASYVIERPETP